MEYYSNRSTMKRKNLYSERSNSFKATLQSPVSHRILHRNSNLSNTTDRSVEYEGLKSKCSQLKQEKARLIAIINSKDTQINLIETQLKKLESDFFQYKSLSQKILTPKEKVSKEAHRLIKLLEENPVVAGKDHNKYLPKLKDYVETNKIYKALVTSLRIPFLLLNKQETKTNTNTCPDDSFDALNKESKYLLESINKQSLSISRMIGKNSIKKPK